MHIVLLVGVVAIVVLARRWATARDRRRAAYPTRVTSRAASSHAIPAAKHVPAPASDPPAPSAGRPGEDRCAAMMAAMSGPGICTPPRARSAGTAPSSPHRTRNTPWP